ncbi:F-box protein SKIP23-like [Macadamia integrifolia]|uniref:F-box protein SKIP23-like n=1 Tax=Macadamia integrifolia TaxID=60698 RepID=UPI001C4EF442|nr:F-box protein SKIP23-like [Macadamia integrifolia]
MAEARKWSELPGELLQKIAKFLTLYADYIRVRAVCVSWQSAIPKTPNHLPRQFPLLMLPYNPESDTRVQFFSLAEKKTYRLDIPFEIHRKFLRGSCHGWLVTVEDTPSVGLFNPFTKVHIELPSFSEFVYHFQGSDSLSKLVLSSSPSSSDFMAIAILGYSFRLAFCRCRDKRWTAVKERDFSYVDLSSSYSDVIFYKEKIVAVKTDGEVIIMDVIGSHGNSTPEVKLKQILRPPDSVRLHFDLSLVESNDDLLIISRPVTLDDNHDYRTIGFAVYKLDFSTNSSGAIDAEWSEVTSLGDRMLFLGLDPSSSFLASDFPGCKGNCIYFTDQNWHDILEGARKEFEFSLFDMDDRRIKPLPSYPRGLPWPPSIWVTPTPI